MYAKLLMWLLKPIAIKVDELYHKVTSAQVMADNNREIFVQLNESCGRSSRDYREGDQKLSTRINELADKVRDLEHHAAESDKYPGVVRAFSSRLEDQSKRLDHQDQRIGETKVKVARLKADLADDRHYNKERSDGIMELVTYNAQCIKEQGELLSSCVPKTPDVEPEPGPDPIKVKPGQIWQHPNNEEMDVLVVEDYDGDMILVTNGLIQEVEGQDYWTKGGIIELLNDKSKLIKDVEPCQSTTSESQTT